MDPTNPLSSNTWTPVGPASNNGQGNSGRVSAIAVDPSDPSGNTVYVAGASGGVWKTTDFLTTSRGGPDLHPADRRLRGQRAEHRLDRRLLAERRPGPVDHRRRHGRGEHGPAGRAGQQHRRHQRRRRLPDLLRRRQDLDARRQPGQLRRLGQRAARGAARPHVRRHGHVQGHHRPEARRRRQHHHLRRDGRRHVGAGPAASTGASTAAGPGR